MSNCEPPKKPPRMKATIATNKLDAAQLAMSCRIVDNDTSAIAATTTNDKEMPLTGQLSIDKATMTKKKHLHFHSPLIKSPIKMTTTITEKQPKAEVASISPENTIKANVPTTTATTMTSKTMINSNVATTKHQHQLNHHWNQHHGRVSKAMSLKGTGNLVARSRLDRGCTTFMYACQQGDISEVLAQLRNKPEVVHQRDNKHKNALHYCTTTPAIAVSKQHCSTNSLVAAASIASAAPELLESADEDGFTPLHLAVIQGNLAMVNLLLSNKADVNVVDNEGHSVVHWATVCGEIEALRAVLAAGAAVTTPDINGGSPLHYAAQMCGASYESKLGVGNTTTQLALEILDILIKHPQSSVDVQDKDGRQPLLWAASAGSAKAVIALVKAGARVESADKDGLTALHCSASRGHTECLDTLISLCGAPTDLIDANGCTALHYAVTLGHADATACLLDLEADPNRQDRKGRTPAHCGCAKGQFETVRLLKDRGANLWLRNAKGDLPVHEAASSGRRELVEWLLEQRPNQINTTSNDGRSLLHIAAANDYTDMCKMLLDHRCEINAVYRNSRGAFLTPLDCALQKGFRSTAKFLQSQGGLPAGKLRLATRRANPFTETSVEFVRPLRYSEREEVHDLSDSKKYVIYRKRSELDTSDAELGECSCSERTYKREQRYAHTCRRHRRMHSRKKKLRRRTSSCGEPKDVCRQEESSDICRSKSNIEINRQKSREPYASSSCTDDYEDKNVDSCENCCYHKHEKQRILHRKRLHSTRHLKDNRDHADQTGKGHKQKIKPVEAVKEQRNEILEKPVGNEQGKPLVLNTPIDVANETTIPVLQPTDDDEETHEQETVTTTVEVHHNAEETNDQRSDEKAPENISQTTLEEISRSKEQAMNEVEEKIEQAVDKVLEIAAAEIQQINITSNEEAANKSTEINPLETVITETTEVTKTMETEIPIADNLKRNHITIEETPATPIEDSKPNNTKTEPNEISIYTNSEQKLDTSSVKNSNAATDDEKGKNESPVITDTKPPQREQETRRSFTLLPSDSAEEEEEEENNEPQRKSSFQILKSDESTTEISYQRRNKVVELSDNQVFKIMPDTADFKSAADLQLSSAEGEEPTTEYVEHEHDESDQVGAYHFEPTEAITATGAVTVLYEQGSCRKRRLKRRVKSAGKTRNNWKNAQDARQSNNLPNKDQQDSGFEPSPRTVKSKIPTPRQIYTAYAPRRPIYATLDGRSCTSRLESRKPGDKFACDMSTVTRSIQRNIRRYYMERKIFQHLLDLKSLQIRSNKLNEAVLVKRAVEDYHKSCAVLGGETGTRLRRYTYSEYTFKNFELFLYETLKSLQKSGTHNFQNINEVYEEAERRLSPDYHAYEKALQCTTKTHRCLHAAHAYTGIPCAAYIPMMNHHTMPKFGFGAYKKSSGVGSFYLPKILTKTSSCGGGKVALELSNDKSKQLISLPAEKFDSNKRYYVTFTVKESGNISTRDCHTALPQTHIANATSQDAQPSTK